MSDLDLFSGLQPAAPERARSVENGVINALSVSQLKTAHLCLLKWWFEKVQRVPAPKFAALDTGIQVHGRLESYLLTGTDALGLIERPGKKYLPLPLTSEERLAQLFPATRYTAASGLLIEHRFDGQEKGAPFVPANAKLRAGKAGTPLDGYIDVLNLRMLESGGRAFPDAPEVDPPGTVEVLDHKTTKNIAKYGAKPEHFTDMEHADGHAIQMVGYGELARLLIPDLKWVRLTHVDYQTGSTRLAKRISKLVPIDQIQIRWFTVNRLADSMSEVAGCHDPKQVQWNDKACGAFGGCPYKAICPRFSPAVAVPRNSQFAQGNVTMPGSLLDELTDSPDVAPAPTASAPAPQPVTLTPVPAPVIPVAPTYEQFLAWQQAQSGGTPAPTAAVPASTPAPIVGPAPAEPRKVGRPKKMPPIQSEEEATAPAQAAAPAPVAQAPSAPAPTPPTMTAAAVPVAQAAAPTPTPAPAPGRIELFVNCTPGGAVLRLDEYIAEKLKRIAEKYESVDVRCAPAKLKNGSDNPIAFGKWKGVLSYLVRQEPPPAGRYAVSSLYEFNQVVIETLMPLCRPEDVVVGKG